MNVSQIVGPTEHIKGLEFVEAELTKYLFCYEPFLSNVAKGIMLNAPDESFATRRFAMRPNNGCWLDMNGEPIASLNGFDNKGKGKNEQSDKGGKPSNKAKGGWFQDEEFPLH